MCIESDITSRKVPLHNTLSLRGGEVERVVSIAELLQSSDPTRFLNAETMMMSGTITEAFEEEVAGNIAEQS